MTKKQAIALYNSGFWKKMTPKQLATFQLFEKRLCMPFEVFHKAVEKALGRPVWTHEFAFQDSLRAELLGDRPAPSMKEIMDLIPAAKRILLEVG